MAGLPRHDLAEIRLRRVFPGSRKPYQDAEDLRTCVYSVELLYTVFVKGRLYGVINKDTVKKNLGYPDNFKLLVENAYRVHAKFCEYSEYRTLIPDIHSKLFAVVNAVYVSKKCRDVIPSIDENAVFFIGQLTTVHHKTKALIVQLVNTLKIICSEKKHCATLASRTFYDGIYDAYKITQKPVVFPYILKYMSRNATALFSMSRNEKIYNLIVELANCRAKQGKKSINKRSLMTTLYRMTNTGDTLRYLSKREIWQGLYHYFHLNEHHEDLQYRIGTIKACTILHRAAKKTVLQPIFNKNFRLPEKVLQQYAVKNEEPVCEDSDPENEDSDDEGSEMSEGDENLNLDTSDVEISPSIIHSTLSEPRVMVLTNELLHENKTAEHGTSVQLTTFINTSEVLRTKWKELSTCMWQSEIEQHVSRFPYINNHAFPDAILAESDSSDDSYLDSKNNCFDIEGLEGKLKCALGISKERFDSRIVYHVEDVSRPAVVPHPLTFQHNRIESPDTESLAFESRFESGNLYNAKQIGRFEYDLIISRDVGAMRGQQWFYFQISNMEANVKYTLNIVNLAKINSQYNYGMQPVFFSVTDYMRNKRGWKHMGEEIIYHGNNYTDETKKQFRTLSFALTFQYGNDYVYVAYHYPYTFTRLMTILYPLTTKISKDIYVRIEKLCSTVSGKNEVPILTITDNSNVGEASQKKTPVIFLSARVHPGESNSSWIIEGAFRFLLDETLPEAAKARKLFIFKIIPMLNPEGTICGNTRNGLTGTDLNRCWLNPDKVLHPEIYYSKSLVAHVREKLKHPCFAYIDIHGHSRKKYFFFYGCNPKLSWNKKDRKLEDAASALRSLPQAVQECNTHMRLPFCKYKVEKNRESTCRVVMWRQFGIQRSYTLECSYCSGNNKKVMTTNMLKGIGASLISAFVKTAELESK